MFTALTCAVLVDRGSPLPGDGPTHRWFARPEAGSLIHAARLVTTLGSVGVAAVVVTAAAAGLAMSRLVRPVVVAVLPVVVAVSSFARTLICVAIGRPRPPRADWFTTAGGDSFPSGHTANATVAYGLLALIVVVALGRPAGAGRSWALFGAALGWGLVASVIGVSRVADAGELSRAGA
ncbi:MAG: phosphatase PAP2 family protein, partial [Frankia sp.]